MFTNSVNHNEYNMQMQSISRMLEQYRDTLNSKVYKNGLRIEKLLELLYSGNNIIKNSAAYLSKKRNMKRIAHLVTKVEHNDSEYVPNYFLDHRIVVYTCFFGNYDILQEPFSRPNNIDYYVVTDQKIPNNTVWKPLDITKYAELLDGYSNVEKNRWIKMHPHTIFPEYRYSVYIDANVVPVTDFTELVNQIGKTGVAMYWHKYNNCVYDEALYNTLILKKADPKEIENQVCYLRKQQMPKNFGMTTCNVIARDHQNDICIKLMEDWWSEFLLHCRRDQLSFPYVVWKNGISMDQIARLGKDVWNSHALYVVDHYVKT